MSEPIDLPPDNPSAPLPSPAGPPARGPRLVCEFCESRLSPAGDVLEMGDKARTYREAKEKIAELTAALQKETARADTLKTEVSTLRSELDAKKKGFFG